MDNNGVLISKPAKKVQVWSLTKDGPIVEQEEKSKAGSISGINNINKLREIHDFMFVTHR